MKEKNVREIRTVGEVPWIFRDQTVYLIQVGYRLTGSTNDVAICLPRIKKNL